MAIHFGYLATQIKAKSICIAVDGAAQKGAIIKNLEDNKVKSPVTFITLTEETPEKCAIAFIKIPKSLEQLSFSCTISCTTLRKILRLFAVL